MVALASSDPDFYSAYFLNLLQFATDHQLFWYYYYTYIYLYYLYFSLKTDMKMSIF